MNAVMCFDSQDDALQGVFVLELLLELVYFYNCFRKVVSGYDIYMFHVQVQVIHELTNVLREDSCRYMVTLSRNC